MQNMHMLKLNKQIFNVNVYTFFGNFSKNIDTLFKKTTNMNSRKIRIIFNII